MLNLEKYELKSYKMSEHKHDDVPLNKYEPLGRIIFAVDDTVDAINTPEYEISNYNKSYLVGCRGAKIKEISDADRVFVPIFELASNPTWKQQISESIKYKLIKKATNDGYTSLYRAEDYEVIKLLNVSVENNEQLHVCNSNVCDYPKDILQYITAGIVDITENGLKPTYIIMKPRLFEYLSMVEHKHLYITKNYDQNNGTKLVGFWKDIPILTNNANGFHDDKMYITASPEYLGVIAIREDIKSTGVFENHQHLRDGIVMSEKIGIAIINDSAVSCVSFTCFKKTPPVIVTEQPPIITQKEKKSFWKSWF